ncbi:MAG: efflux RND transporter periplasmic adaptor subunit [Methylococcales bacterium]|nr:efflux RND transporter periplasmic adaptor subunit [Methylococcales bacterium]MBT7410120.1 efflux RND transporter periplasmic adaptor subunit [Methylococcales bacterium]
MIKQLAINTIIGIISMMFTFNSFAADDRTSVTVKKLHKLYMYPRIESPATVVSLNDSSISAEVSSKIIEMPVAVGDIVFRDAILARLNSTDFELEKKRLRVSAKKISVRLQQARSKLKRYQKLAGGVSREKVRQAKGDVQVLEFDLQDIKVRIAQASRNIEKCTIKGPFTGLILKRLGKVGEFVSPGKPLIRVLDIEHIEVSAQVQTRDIESLKEAKELILEYRNEKYPLKLRSVVALLDERTRTQEVRLIFKDKHALPGTSGRLVWQQIQPHVSPEYLVRRRGKLGLLLYINGRAKFEQLGKALEGRPVPVTLPIKSLVIIKGRYSAKDGDRVHARNIRIKRK